MQTANGDDDEAAAEGIHAEEISPELMYTAEHPVFTPRVNVVAERPSAENENGNGNGDAQGGEGPGKRRRGRRGARRGRGGDDTPSGTS